MDSGDNRHCLLTTFTRMFFWLAFLGFMAMGASAAQAISPAPAAQAAPPKARSIPLPNQSEYLQSGLQAGLGAGNVWRAGCQTRFQWQGGAEYSYSERISGGASFRMFGGNIDSSQSLVYSRYFMHARAHFQPSNEVDLYIGPVLGLDNANFQAIRDNLRRVDTVTTAAQTTCQEAFDVGGVGVGWDAGVGWMPFQLVGFTAANTLEVNSRKDVRITIALGTSFNVREVWERLQTNLQSAWIHLDWITATTTHSIGFEKSLLLGFSFGF